MSSADSVVDAERGFRYRWLVTSMNFLVMGLSYADKAVIGLAGLLIIKQFGFSNTEFGIITSVFFFGYIPMVFLGGYLADRFGPRNVLGVAIAWWSLFVACTAAGFNFISFIVIRFLFGVGEGPQGPVTSKNMANWYPKKELGLATAFPLSGQPLGGAISAPLVVGLILLTNWRVPFIVLGALGILFTIGWFVVVRDSPELHPWVSKAESDHILKTRVGREAEAAGIQDRDIPGIWRFIREPLVICTALAVFGWSWILYTFLTWFPIYLQEAQHVKLSTVAWAAALPWIAGFIGLNAGGLISDVLVRKTGNGPASRKGIIVVSFLIVAVLLGLSMTSSNVYVAVAYMSGVLLCMYPAGINMQLLIADLVPSLRYGSVNGFTQAFGNIAGLVSPFFVGLIVDQTHSWALTFGIAAALCAAAGIIMLLLANIRRMRAIVPVDAKGPAEPAATLTSASTS